MNEEKRFKSMKVHEEMTERPDDFDLNSMWHVLEDHRKRMAALKKWTKDVEMAWEVFLNNIEDRVEGIEAWIRNEKWKSPNFPHLNLYGGEKESFPMRPIGDPSLANSPDDYPHIKFQAGEPEGMVIDEPYLDLSKVASRMGMKLAEQENEILWGLLHVRCMKCNTTVPIKDSRYSRLPPTVLRPDKDGENMSVKVEKSFRVWCKDCEDDDQEHQSKG